MRLSVKAAAVIFCLVLTLSARTAALAGTRLIYETISNGQEKTVFTVPQGKIFILKSFVLTNASGNANRLVVNNDSQTLMFLAIGADETLMHNFQGVIFKSGEEVRLFNLGTDNLTATLTGTVKKK
jgi:hypothetical protein